MSKRDTEIFSEKRKSKSIFKVKGEYVFKVFERCFFLLEEEKVNTSNLSVDLSEVSITRGNDCLGFFLGTKSTYDEIIFPKTIVRLLGKTLIEDIKAKRISFAKTQNSTNR